MKRRSDHSREVFIAYLERLAQEIRRHRQELERREERERSRLISAQLISSGATVRAWREL